MEVEDLYYHKYLKYKNKYLNLQSQIAGSSPSLFGKFRTLLQTPAQRRAAQAEAQMKAQAEAEAQMKASAQAAQAEEAQRRQKILKEITELNYLSSDIYDERVALNMYNPVEMDLILDKMYILIKIWVKKLFNEKKLTDPKIILNGSNDSYNLAFDDSEINTYLPGTKMDLNKISKLKNDINTLKSKVGGRDDKTVVADIYKLCLELYYIYRAILVDLDPEKVKSYY